MKPGLKPKGSFGMLVLKGTTDSELARRKWKKLPVEGDLAKALREKEGGRQYLFTGHQKS